MSELVQFPGDRVVPGMPKIYSPFKRATEGPNKNKLKEGEWYESAFATLQDASWRWTEKLDGTNIRIHWDGIRRSIAGRTERAVLAQDLVAWIDEQLPEELFEQKFGSTPVTLYGEGVGPGIQAGGGKYSAVKKFILFEVLLGGVWRTNETIDEVAEAFGIERAPFEFISDIETAIDVVADGYKSNYGDFYAEGLVGVPVDGFLRFNGSRIMMKIKHCDFFLGER